MGGLNRAKYSHDVYKCFADQPGHPWDADLFAILLYYHNIKPILTQRFRQKQACHQVVFKSAMGKMIGGSVGSFHVFGEKLGSLSQKRYKSVLFKGTPVFIDLLSNYFILP